MLLRRVAEHVRTQNWFAVAIDFVVVVVGVFLGFQITQWNEQRLEQSIERTYVERLSEDFQRDIVELNTIIGLTEQRFAYGSELVGIYDSGVYDGSPKSLVEAVEMANFFSYPSYSTGTIDDLMSTGNLRIISNDEVKEVVARYYQSIEWTEQFRENHRVVQQALSNYTPELLELGQRVALFNERGTSSCSSDLVCGRQLPWGSRTLSVSAEEADVLLDRLMERPQLRTLFASMARIQATHYGNLTGIREVAQEALKRIETYSAALQSSGKI